MFASVTTAGLSPSGKRKRQRDQAVILQTDQVCLLYRPQHPYGLPVQKEEKIMEI